jgi:hypothetical protein
MKRKSLIKQDRMSNAKQDKNKETSELRTVHLPNSVSERKKPNYENWYMSKSRINKEFSMKS